MEFKGGTLQLSASDLVGHVSCCHPSRGSAWVRSGAILALRPTDELPISVGEGSVHLVRDVVIVCQCSRPAGALGMSTSGEFVDSGGEVAAGIRQASSGNSGVEARSALCSRRNVSSRRHSKIRIRPSLCLVSLVVRPPRK